MGAVVSRIGCRRGRWSLCMIVKVEVTAEYTYLDEEPND